MLKNDKIFMYVSLWKEHGGAPGLGLFSFDVKTGEIEFLKKLNSDISFNCSHIDTKNNILYISNEVEKIPGFNFSTGRIYGYRLSPETGDITELFHRETLCPNPSYLNFDSTGRFMIVAHHSSPNYSTRLEKNADGEFEPHVTFNDSVVELYEMNEDGTMGKLVDVKKHVSDAPLYDRFGRLGNCHPHCVVFSPSGKLFAVCDKGDGKIYLYTIDRENKKLVLLNSALTDEEGCAPRYCAFHPTKPYIFVNHEHAHNNKLTVSSLKYDENGSIEKICTVSALPADYAMDDSHHEQQGFCIHPSGKYLYSITHGFNSVAVFEVDENTGKISLKQNIPIEGEWPRGAALSPNGRFLVASCLASGDISVYSIGEDGCLTNTGSHAKLQGGSYISFYEPNV
ncbi:MAG: lactonase family protein [Oscillospiraceae bacterium]